MKRLAQIICFFAIFIPEKTFARFKFFEPLAPFQKSCDFASPCAKANHLAVDLAGPAGAKVLAPATGIVKEAKWVDGYGGTVIIEHDDGCDQMTSILGHMKTSTLQVSPGQKVEGGKTVIGYLGTSSENGGWATHTHWGVHKGKYQPGNYLCNGSYEWNYAGYTNCPSEVFPKWHDPLILLNPEFNCKWVSQKPDTTNPYVMETGQEDIFEINFKNTSPVSWLCDSANGTANPQHVELWSVDKWGGGTISFLYHPSWIDQKRVKSICPNSPICQNGVAHFEFKVKVPDIVGFDKINVNLPIYFAPSRGSKTSDNCWDGANFLIKVKEKAECKEGELIVDDCGNCGTRYQECKNGKWSTWSECDGEGECYYPNETEIQKCGDTCWTQSRYCEEGCTWGPWEECSYWKICEPGQSEEKPCGENVGECKVGIKTKVCQDICHWGVFGDCVTTDGPSEETCDGKDNDCDGKIDGDFCLKKVFRFYYSKNQDKDHFLKNDDDVPAQYVIEGGGKPVFHTYKTQISGTNPLFRLYKNAIIDHMYTDSKDEKESVIAIGYEVEGNIGYCAAQEAPGTVPLYRCWSAKYSDHLSTLNKDECDAEGYDYEQVTCYVWP